MPTTFDRILVQQEVAFGKQLMEEMNGFLFLIVF
jgi:hypothetical protein